MLTFAEMQRFTDDFELVYNRIDIINQLLGVGFQHPCRLVYHKGRYSCMFMDYFVCDFGVYDVPGCSAALAKLDTWHDLVWQLSRSGFITQRTTQCLA